MKIAILTMFNGLSNTYSLVNVVEEQLKMLLSDNITVKMLVSQHCPDSDRTGIFADKRIEWVKIINSSQGKTFRWKTYTKATDVIEEDFFDQARLISNDYIKYLEDVDICIMHDILYQGVHLLHNVAIRLAQQFLPNLKFIAFTHSAPVEHLDAPYPINCMFTGMPNTTFVYPTKCGLPYLAKQYAVDVSDCAYINNALAPTLSLSEQTKQIVNSLDLCSKDIVIIYPARLCMSKKFHVVAEFAGYFKKYFGKSVGVVFCDFSCSDIPPNMYKHLITDYAYLGGLEKDELTFTSNLGFTNGVSRQTVLELFTLSNLFICPSYSESFGLTVLEASSRANFLVLNQAVPALYELGLSLNAYFMRWSAKNYGFDTIETYHPSQKSYYIENAQKILNAMQDNDVLRAKTLTRLRYSDKRIYLDQLKPLLISLTK